MECEKTRKRVVLPDQVLTVNRERKLPGDIDIQILFRARRQMLIMMIDRGFDFRNFTDVDKEYLNNTRPKMDQISIRIFQNPKLEVPEDTDTFKSFGNPRVSSNLVLFLLREMTTEEFDIYQQTLQMWQESFVSAGIKVLTLITNDAKERTEFRKKLKKIPGIYLQTYSIEELVLTEIIYPPTRHYLIPFSFRMVAEQIGELEISLMEKKWGLDHLPALSSYDPYSKFHALIPGDIIQIFRHSVSGDTMLDTAAFYRRIIDVPIADEFKI